MALREWKDSAVAMPEPPEGDLRREMDRLKAEMHAAYDRAKMEAMEAMKEEERLLHESTVIDPATFERVERVVAPSRVFDKTIHSISASSRRMKNIDLEDPDKAEVLLNDAREEMVRELASQLIDLAEWSDYQDPSDMTTTMKVDIMVLKSTVD